MQQLWLRPQAERWGPLSQEGQGPEVTLSSLPLVVTLGKSLPAMGTQMDNSTCLGWDAENEKLYLKESLV